MTNFNLSIRHWRFTEIKAVIKEIKLLLPSAMYTSDNYGYQKLSKGNNKELFKLLNKIGFFDFHSTNNGFICYMHQITLYLHKGWKMYRKGLMCNKGVLEIHHKDHNPSNCNPQNLVYVTPYENKLLSRIVQSGFYLGKVINKTLSTCTRKFKEIVKATRELTLAHLACKSLI